MLDRGSSTPLYMQLAELLRGRITSGALKPGDKLPSESELVERLEIGRLTVREALALLVNEGLLEKKHGKGTYVRAARPGRPLRIDVLLDLGDRFFTPFYLEGITRVLRKYGANCVLNNTRGSQTEIAERLMDAARAGAAGVLVQPPQEDQPLPEALRRAFAQLRGQRIPLMFLDNCYEGVEASCALFDEKQAGRLAAQHFAECGHQYLAMIGNDARRDAFFRALGFEDYFIQHGYVAPVVENEEEDLGAQLHRILRANPEITGLFCYNDGLAVRALEALRARGLRVPSRISVIGCDGIPLASAVTPHLTTVVHPKDALSAQAAETLLKIIHNPALAPCREFFPPSLSVGDSCSEI